MQVVRTILWVLLLVGILAFSFGNWDREIDVRIWPGIVWDTRVPALVIVSFLLGLVPTWLYHRGVQWRQSRRIAALETATTTMRASRSETAATTAPTRPDPARSDAGSPPATTRPDSPPRPANPVDPITTDRP